MKEMGGGEVSFLSEDGEVVRFAVVGLPELIEGKFKGQPTQRIGMPIVTIEGFSLLIVGKRIARRISKYEAVFKKAAFELIRHGAAEDTDTKYELLLLEDKKLEKALLEMAASSDFKEEIEDAMKSALEIAVG